MTIERFFKVLKASANSRFYTIEMAPFKNEDVSDRQQNKTPENWHPADPDCRSH